MKFKGVDNLTGKELCDIEEFIFPVIGGIDEKDIKGTAGKELLQLIQEHGEEIVKICYMNDDGSEIIEINENYRMRLMKEALIPVMTKLFSGGDDKGKSKTNPKKIQPRS